MELTVRLVLPTISRKIKIWVAALAATALLLVPVVALASDVFGDVPGTLPQHDAINRVYAAGIMRACTAGTPPNFCPNDVVLRAQQASQWDRALGLNGIPAAGTYVSRAVSADINPLQVATLRWYRGSEAGGDFAVATNPRAVAFDGASVWIASLSGTVTKLRASDGACIGTCSFAVDSSFGIAVDGASVWVSNFGGNTVTKLRASDGACVGTCTFAVGTQPRGVAFDGNSVWVANSGSNTVTKLRASDSFVLGTFAVGTNPWGVAFDGASVWLANNGSGTVSKR